nr:unnamed protein product [Spirometra erinaceieuropaei]
MFWRMPWQPSQLFSPAFCFDLDNCDRRADVAGSNERFGRTLCSNTLQNLTDKRRSPKEYSSYTTFSVTFISILIYRKPRFLFTFSLCLCHLSFIFAT